MLNKQLDRLIWILVGCATGFAIVLIADPYRPISANPSIAAKSGVIILKDARRHAIITDQAVGFCDRNRLLIDAPDPQAPGIKTENDVSLTFRGRQLGRGPLVLRPQPYEKDF
jgi:hypothetical protein